MKYLSYISTTLLGVMFLVLAFAKAWNAEAFADMLLLYGPEWFSIGAPVIIFIEAVMGMLLLLRVRPQWSTIAAVAFLVTVSVIFAYGVAFQGYSGLRLFRRTIQTLYRQTLDDICAQCRFLPHRRAGFDYEKPVGYALVA